jgi:hypothetical protein
MVKNDLTKRWFADSDVRISEQPWGNEFWLVRARQQDVPVFAIENRSTSLDCSHFSIDGCFYILARQT